MASISSPKNEDTNEFTFTDHQIKCLRECFDACKGYSSQFQKTKLSEDLNIPYEHVFRWFVNERDIRENNHHEGREESQEDSDYEEINDFTALREIVESLKNDQVRITLGWLKNWIQKAEVIQKETESRIQTWYDTTVSYTHLTLPTILLV